MSKPKSKFLGWKSPRKGECAYKDNISREHRFAYRKTWHIKRDVVPFPLGGKCDKHVPNAKRRPCVQARLDKLNKYVMRAWKGYSFGRLPKKVAK